jgi:hypothetical protein
MWISEVGERPCLRLLPRAHTNTLALFPYLHPPPTHHHHHAPFLRPASQPSLLCFAPSLTAPPAHHSTHTAQMHRYTGDKLTRSGCVTHVRLLQTRTHSFACAFHVPQSAGTVAHLPPLSTRSFRSQVPEAGLWCTYVLSNDEFMDASWGKSPHPQHRPSPAPLRPSLRERAHTRAPHPLTQTPPHARPRAAAAGGWGARGRRGWGGGGSVYFHEWHRSMHHPPHTHSHPSS